MKYRKKPVVVEAFRIGFEPIPEWFLNASLLGTSICGIYTTFSFNGEVDVVFVTLEGEMHAHRGDYIIKGVNSEIYPCKADIFEKTYERLYDDGE